MLNTRNQTHHSINGEVKVLSTIRQHKHPYNQLRQAELAGNDLELFVLTKQYEQAKRERWNWLSRIWHKWVSGLFNPKAARKWEELNSLAGEVFHAELGSGIEELAVVEAERSRLLAEHPELLDPEQKLQLQQEAYYQMLAANFVAEHLASTQRISRGYAELLLSLPEKDRQALTEEYHRQMMPVISLFFSVNEQGAQLNGTEFIPLAPPEHG